MSSVAADMQRTNILIVDDTPEAIILSYFDHL